MLTRASTALRVPHGKYKSARSVKGRPDHIFNPDRDDGTDTEYPPAHLQYVYEPGSGGSLSSRSSFSTPSPRYPPRALTWNGVATGPAGAAPTHGRNRSLPEVRMTSPSPANDGEAGFLAPLEYLQAVTPPRRHPMDETALKLFRGA